jgi:hypothetical protein
MLPAARSSGHQRRPPKSGSSRADGASGLACCTGVSGSDRAGGVGAIAVGPRGLNTGAAAFVAGAEYSLCGGLSLLAPAADGGGGDAVRVATSGACVGSGSL